MKRINRRGAMILASFVIAAPVAAATSYSLTGARVSGYVTGDFDGDGDTDIALAFDDLSNGVFLGGALALIDANVPLALSPALAPVAVDVDQDGDDDIVLNDGSCYLSGQNPDGDPVFTPSQCGQVPTQATVCQSVTLDPDVQGLSAGRAVSDVLTAADLDDDGNPDCVGFKVTRAVMPEYDIWTPRTATSSFHWKPFRRPFRKSHGGRHQGHRMYGTGGGYSYTPPHYFSQMPNTIRHHVVLYYVSMPAAAAVTVVLADGSTLTSPEISGYINRVVVTDYDGDGFADVMADVSPLPTAPELYQRVYVTPSKDSWYVFPNDGSGQLGQAVPVATGLSPLGDFDGDGLMDMARIVSPFDTDSYVAIQFNPNAGVGGVSSGPATPAGTPSGSQPAPQTNQDPVEGKGVITAVSPTTVTIDGTYTADIRTATIEYQDRVGPSPAVGNHIEYVIAANADGSYRLIQGNIGP